MKFTVHCNFNGVYSKENQLTDFEIAINNRKKIKDLDLKIVELYGNSNGFDQAFKKDPQYKDIVAGRVFLDPLIKQRLLSRAEIFFQISNRNENRKKREREFERLHAKIKKRNPRMGYPR